MILYFAGRLACLVLRYEHSRSLRPRTDISELARWDPRIAFGSSLPVSPKRRPYLHSRHGPSATRAGTSLQCAARFSSPLFTTVLTTYITLHAPAIYFAFFAHIGVDVGWGTGENVWMRALSATPPSFVGLVVVPVVLALVAWMHGEAREMWEYEEEWAVRDLYGEVP